MMRSTIKYFTILTHSIVYNGYTLFYRQLGCLVFNLRFWPKIKQLLSNYKTKQLLSNFFASVLFLVELRN